MTHSRQHSNLIYRIPNHVVAVTLSHLRKINGIIKKLGKRKSHHSDSSSSNSRYACLLAVLWIGGCTSLKKAGLIGGASLLGGAIASTVSSGTVPVLLAGATSASVTSVVADVMESNTPSLKGADMTSCAPDNFFTLLGDLVSMGGWFLILRFVVPMLLGWILPGPLTRKKK